MPFGTDSSHSIRFILLDLLCLSTLKFFYSLTMNYCINSQINGNVFVLIKYVSINLSLQNFKCYSEVIQKINGNDHYIYFVIDFNFHWLNIISFTSVNTFSHYHCQSCFLFLCLAILYLSMNFKHIHTHLYANSFVIALVKTIRIKKKKNDKDDGIIWSILFWGLHLSSMIFCGNPL